MKPKYSEPWTHPQCPRVKRQQLVNPTGAHETWWARIHLRECRVCQTLHQKLTGLANLQGRDAAFAVWAQLQAPPDRVANEVS